jgi:lysozyme family protein
MISRHEGGFSWDENDPGGPTKYGISLATIESLNLDIDGDGKTDIKDVRAMTYDQAKSIYKKQYWDKAYLDECEDQRVANRIMDIIVNTGHGGAMEICSRALLSCTLDMKSYSGFDEIIDMVNIINDDIMVISLRSEQAGYYRVLAERNQKLKRFLRGWLNRAYDDEF